MDEQELTYRSLSNTAVIGLLLAVFSGLSFFWPTLWPLAFVALVVSWSAARTIGKNKDLLAGINLARLGIFLATAIGVATLVKVTTLQRLHESHADLVSSRFIELVVSDNLVGAFELTLPYKDRQPTPEHAAIQYETDLEAIEAFEDFKSLEPVRALEKAEQNEVQLVNKKPTTPSSYGRYITGRLYEIDPAKKSSEQKSAGNIFLVLERSSNLSPSPISWHVKEVRIQATDR